MSVTVDVRYRYRLRVSNAQAPLLLAVFDVCRFVWNQALGRWQDLWRQERISLGYADANRELTDWRSRFEWLAEQPSVPQQQVLRDLYRAIGAFYDKSNPARRPVSSPARPALPAPAGLGRASRCPAAAWAAPEIAYG